MKLGTKVYPKERVFGLQCMEPYIVYGVMKDMYGIRVKIVPDMDGYRWYDITLFHPVKKEEKK